MYGSDAKDVLVEYQTRKQEEIQNPFLGDVFFLSIFRLQAMLLELGLSGAIWTSILFFLLE